MFEVPEDFRGPLSQSAIELISIDFLDDGEWWVTALTKLKISLVFNGFSDIEAVRRDSERINSVHESVTAAIVAMEKAQDAETLYGKLSAKMIADHFAEHGETLISFGSTSYGGGKI